VGFEPTISVFERAKTVHALGRAAAVIGLYVIYCYKTQQEVSSLVYLEQSPPTLNKVDSDFYGDVSMAPLSVARPSTEASASGAITDCSSEGMRAAGERKAVQYSQQRQRWPSQ
jgi:hypothetical protein